MSISSKLSILEPSFNTKGLTWLTYISTSVYKNNLPKEATMGGEQGKCQEHVY